ncbi:hypothetical protein SAY87_024721 [Trapa incisa]|uniref:RING-type E3 ubiquitin transferase n=1 Tax=Trapa incisa TaxID=236973 RepID=A0AAN7GCH0_9MYRT|nr:hypothetical protein SAY87_024721 [Trapa incisa]
MISPSHPPLPLAPFWASYPSSSPSPSQAAAPPDIAAVVSGPFSVHQSPPEPPSRSPISFSPPLIAMVAVVAAALFIVFYSRPIYRHLLRLSRWQRRRRRVHRSASSVDFGSPTTTGFFDSPFPDPTFHYSYGLDDSVIKTIPLSLYTSKMNKYGGAAIRECAVCLLEFEEDDYVRTLPVCSHAFHVDCIDVWLRSQANCPLCRAAVFGPESPFVPMMAARIRPSFDEDPILRDIIMEETVADLDPEEPPVAVSADGEITEEQPSPRRERRCSDDRFGDFMLKRSYSFSFERSIMSERILVTEPVTASPWRYRRGGGGFWSKRLSPFGTLSKPRVFSFQYYRGMKSPFFRRRGFFPLSESSVRFSTAGSGGGGGSSRRSKSLMSPMFTMRSGATTSSSRLRCGDPEALLSPERFNRR